MKTKPFIFFSILTTFTFIFLFSCDKFEENEIIAVDQTDQVTSLKDASFNPQFDWETMQTFTFTVSSKTEQVINITSSDKTIRYYKGMHPGNASTYVVKVSVPTDVESLNINNQELILNTKNISIEL